MNLPKRPCLITIGRSQVGHFSSVGSPSGRSLPGRLFLYLHSGYAEQAMNLPNRPQRSLSASPHSGQASPVSTPPFMLRMCFLASARSFWKGL